MVTAWTGFSNSNISFEPISKLPAGIRLSSGQSSQSRTVRACVALAGTGVCAAQNSAVHADPAGDAALRRTDAGNDGYYLSGTVSGHLYLDTNGDGDQDSGEPDLDNVDVIVTDAMSNSLRGRVAMTGATDL